MKFFSTMALLVISVSQLLGQLEDSIRINQEGYFQTGTKYATVITSAAIDSFFVASEDLNTIYFGDTLGAPTYWSQSNETYALADFSSFTASGTYRLSIPSVGYVSHPFQIKNRVLIDPLKTAIKSYYFARCSSPVLQQYGGNWARNAGHIPDTALIHGSAASAWAPEGISVPGGKGWYDAGDYNKYVVPASFANYFFMLSYELYPMLFDSLTVNIPESGNGVPDLLDESLWNLRWLLTMQDPVDGGVYHKQTTASFESFVMPEFATNTRYMVQKSTDATFSFAAIMAQAARVYEPFYPTFADSCLMASRSAFDWGLSNPSIAYDQGVVNSNYSPTIVTGQYDGSGFDDEKDWAAAELYITTKEDSFYVNHLTLGTGWYGEPTWAKKFKFAAWSLAVHKDSLTTVANLTTIKNKVKVRAESIKNFYLSTELRTPQTTAWWWGSNALALTKALTPLVYHKIYGADTLYFEAGLGGSDYILGRNATTYSFFTGIGDKPVMHPHHRPSEADTVIAPIPGMVVGGPNSSASHTPGYGASNYGDNSGDYTVNEVAINYTAPTILLFAILQDHYLNGDYAQLNCTRHNISIDTTVCEFYTSSAGDHWTISGDYIDTLISSQGCDSILHISLEVLGLPIVTLDGLSTNTLCITSSPVNLVGNPAGGIFDGPGISGSEFSPSLAGIGSHEITYTYIDNSGCSNADTLTLTVDECLSTTTVPKPELSITPNPFKNQVVINYVLPETYETAYIQLHDANGLLVKTISMNSSLRGSLVLQTNELSTGLYSCSIWADGQIIATQKIVKSD